MSPLLTSVLLTLRARRDEIEVRHGVRLLGVVGSVARGDDRPDSDIDILYVVTGRPTLFDLSDIMFELQEAFGRKIDLVDRNGLRPRAKAYLERDLVLA